MGIVESIDAGMADAVALQVSDLGLGMQGLGFQVDLGRCGCQGLCRSNLRSTRFSFQGF